MITGTRTSGFLRASLPFNPINFPKFAAWGWCWHRPRRKNDGWMESLPGISGLAGSCLQYHILYTTVGQPGYGDTVPDPRTGERSIALRQRATHMIYSCSNAARRIFGSGPQLTILCMCVHECACARACVCVRACASSHDPPSFS